MNMIRAVLGDVSATELGPTNAHEHLFIRDGLILVREPDFRLDSEDAAIEEVRDFARFGGRAIIDTSPIGVGRNPDGLVIVSRTTGVLVVAATGFHKPIYYLDSHWRNYLSVDEMAKLFAEEIREGMDVYGFDGPKRVRSAARAGVIKVAADYQRFAPQVVRGFEAAGLAHQMTGAPVLTHTEMGTLGMQQLDLLRANGVESKRVVLSHMDRNPDWRLHRDLAQTGAFLEYDGPGRIKYLPEGKILDLMFKMFELGLGGHLLLGGDTARRVYWKAYGGGPGMAYVMEQFVPRMRREGFGEDAIEQVLIHNPAQAFAFCPTDSSELKVAE